MADNAIDAHVDLSDAADKKARNKFGESGPVCNWCGGFGYTLRIKEAGGGTASCPKCLGSGIEPGVSVQQQVNDLRAQVGQIADSISQLREVILAEAQRREQT